MEKELDGDDVIVEIIGAKEKSDSSGANEESVVEKQESGSYSFKKYLKVDPPPAAVQAVQLNQDAGLRARKKVPSFTGSSTIEISNISPVSDQIVDEDTNRRSLAQSPYPKAKSRLIEPAIPSSWKMDDDKVHTTGSPSEKAKTPKISAPVTPRTPLLVSAGEDEDDDVYYTKVIEDNQTGKRPKKLKDSRKHLPSICSSDSFGTSIDGGF